jgi:hypothetical protein
MRLLHIVHPADLRCRQDGLILQAKTAGIDVRQFKPGDIVAFLNQERTKLALLAMTGEKDSAGVYGYYRSPHGRVPPEAFEFISDAFGSTGFDMTKAIKSGLEKLLSKRRKV